MTTLKVKDKTYKIKFGYKALAKSGVLKEVVKMQSAIGKKDENDDVVDLKDENDDVVDLIADVFDILAKLVLAGLQKLNKTFLCDYDDESSVLAGIEKVYDFLDEYMEEEESLSVMDLFTKLTDELLNNGFLSKKSKELEENLEKQDATIIPMDHQKAEN